MAAPVDRKLAAIVLGDIAGFSALMERDESRTFERVRSLRDEVISPRISEHGGRVVKTTGDGFLAEFVSATSALKCAIALQRENHAREAGVPADERIRMRIGINVGDVISDGNDIAGDGVVIAARLEPLATPDGICVSANVRDHVREDLGIHFEDLGEQKVKNIARPIRAYRIEPVGERGSGETAAAARSVAPPASAGPSIAVLPFVNMSRDEENEYFADGLTEELLNVLAGIRELRVASRTSAFYFKGKDVDIPTIAKKLNVGTVLEGSVRKSGKRARITAQLIDVASDSHIWSGTYDRELDDIFAVQDDIAKSVVTELRKALLATGGQPGPSIEEIRTSTGRTQNAAALELYLQGRFFLHRTTRADAARALELFREAIELDPAYALAWANLSGAWWQHAAFGWMPYDTAYAEARSAAKRAIELAPGLAQGYIALARVLQVADHDYAGASAALDRAYALAPKDAEVLRALARQHIIMRRPNEAIERLRESLKLDPLSFASLFNLAVQLAFAGQLDEGEAMMRTAAELNPGAGLVHFAIAVMYLLRGRPAEALQEAQREALPSNRLRIMALAEHALGHRVEAEAAMAKLIREHHTDDAYGIAANLAWMGKIDDAFAWLDKAVAQNDPGMVFGLQADPLFSNLRADPRWPGYIKAMGLPC